MKMKHVTATISFLILGSFFLIVGASAQNASAGKQMPDLSDWPKASQTAANEMIQKYGEPDMVGKEMLGWMDAGPWKMIHVAKADTKHNFPIEHTDMLEQSISYQVPPEKYDELGEFDGSIVVDRTQGLLSARCDMEANNLLALNLAHDIVTGKKSVEEARQAYGDIVKEKMNGLNPEYMQKLTFEQQPRAADPDKNTTGLTKEDVMRKQKNKG